MATHLDERGNRVASEDKDKDKDVVETPVEARQGFLGRPVLMVLVGGLFLAMIAWGISEMFGEAVDNDAATDVNQSTTTEPNAVVTPTDQKVIDNTPPAGEKMQTAPTDRDPTAGSGTGGDSQSVAPAGTEKTQ
ncbi:hypothetical protein ACDY96_30290 [Rhizobium mongolense]|uniref:hypothetical protein n=1 Tax=Rhizobium TaxID=379 RepID=UPI0024B200C1|nr:hypothetical protein [Rhizobium sp. CC1099]WFU89424.1 hypothetical protein QA644_10475 [Rhizobium sp. CC1099]